MIDPADRHQGHHADETPREKHDQGGHDRLSETAHNGAAHMREAAEEEEETADPGAEAAIVDDFRFCVEKTNKLRAEDEVQRTHGKYDKDRCDEAKTDSLTHAVLFAGTVVLGDESRHGH